MDSQRARVAQGHRIRLSGNRDGPERQGLWASLSLRHVHGRRHPDECCRPGGEYDALVVDSSPSRISGLGCPEEYDPVRQLPADGSKLMLIIGLRDRVVPPRDIEEMAKVVQDRGGVVLKSPEFGHPLMDLDPASRRRRFQVVADFLRR